MSIQRAHGIMLRIADASPESPIVVLRLLPGQKTAGALNAVFDTWKTRQDLEVRPELHVGTYHRNHPRSQVLEELRREAQEYGGLKK